MRSLRLAIPLAAVVALVAFLPSARTAYAPVQPRSTASLGQWAVYHHDDAHTGFDNTLPQVTSVTAGWASPSLTGEIYASPLIFNGVVYTGTQSDWVYAIDQQTGVVIWSKFVGAQQTTGWVCGNTTGGILGTPVIDTAANRIYVVAELAASGLIPPTYHLFGLDLANSGNIVLDVALSPPNFDWKIQQQRGALALHNGYVYIPLGGRAGDCTDNGTDYHGYVVGIPTAGGSEVDFQTPSGSTGTLWTAGGIMVDDANGHVFGVTGNGGCPTPYNYNDAVLRFDSATLAANAPSDFFAPQDWCADWSGNDQDLTNAVLIDSTHMFASGKWGMGFLLNASSLGGIDGQLYPTPKPATYVQAPVCFGDTHDATFASLAYAAPYVYLDCESTDSSNHGIVAIHVDTVNNSFTPCPLACPAPDWHSGGSTIFGPPIVAGGAVWAASNNNGLTAYNATDGSLIYQSAAFGINRFVTPAEAGGQVFVPSHNVIRSFNMHFDCAGTALFASYFNWYDNATHGMVGDNIHLLNTGATTSTGCVTVGARSIPFSVPAGTEQHVSFPTGTIGGPVLVTVLNGPAVQASQRVQYFQSFNEVWAMTAAQAATTSYINWFDKATPGMVGDNIHVLNPQTSTATVTVSLSGQTPFNFNLPAGQEQYVSFPAGAIGGPVVVTSSIAVLASQRVQYFQSFNEVVARSAAQASSTSYFNWFDTATVGMVGDNVHVLNTSGSTASVTVSLAGASNQVLNLAPGVEGHVTFGPGHIGGPVTVSSSVAVLASQRVQYYQSFNEVASESASQALGTSHIMWFDKATSGMVGDNIHVLNTSGSTANVSVSVPGGTTQNLSLAPGVEGYVTFAFGVIGGPVTISSNVPVVAAQRVQYFQSFNEVPSA